jgi:hypothetical protein
LSLSSILAGLEILAFFFHCFMQRQGYDNSTRVRLAFEMQFIPLANDIE